MQTKKKLTGRNCGEVASLRVLLRQQKKLVDIQAKKVTELITSSTRKKKVVGTPTNAIDEPIADLIWIPNSDWWTLMIQMCVWLMTNNTKLEVLFQTIRSKTTR